MFSDYFTKYSSAVRIDLQARVTLRLRCGYGANGLNSTGPVYVAPRVLICRHAPVSLRRVSGCLLVAVSTRLV